ncbi:MAG: undecaprenyl-diphosphate phosphatase [Oscillospiraceae bacterium]|nr:undecaprenyl-diphosphate phosphatase [Oscillospiraceae bacterium]
MSLNLIESIIYGLFSGLTEILPVSGQAHRNLMLQLMGQGTEDALLRLLIHAGILAALYYSCQNHILRMIRAKRLSRVPKRRRKRPLDVRSLMDLSLLKTMVIPVIVALLLYGKAVALNQERILVCVLLFLNGVILYVPQYLPGGNRDSRTLSRVEGIWMGLGGALSVLPGISYTGAGVSIASVCGVDKAYGLGMTLLMCMLMTAGLMVHDVLAVVSVGLSGVSFMVVLGYILAGIAAFFGAYLAVRILRAIIKEHGFGIFAFYCWGVSLFTFILYLTV